MSTAAELKQSDNLFIHPWDDIAKIGSHQRTLLNKGDGVYVYDSEGNRLLDALAGMWCVNIGHGREEMAQAVYDQIMGLTYVSPWSMTTGPAFNEGIELSAKNKQDCGQQQKPRNSFGKYSFRRLQQQPSTQKPSNQTDDDNFGEFRSMAFQVVAKSVCAAHVSGTRGVGIGSISDNGRYTNKQQCGKGNKTATASNRINHSADKAG